MNTVAPKTYIKDMDVEALADACASASPSADHQQLLSNIKEAVPDKRFIISLSRTGWHRIGGIVTPDGERITDNLREWAERECTEGIPDLLDKYANTTWFATRLDGKTLYLCASTGARARDFVQLEVEQVQEVLDRPLFDQDWMPDDLEEFIDPLDFPRLEPEPLGPPYYRFRRITPISDLIEELGNTEDQAPAIARFLDDWERSSAGQEATFFEHWVLVLSPYTDRYGEQKYSIKPLTAYTGELPAIGDSHIEPGAALANRIHSFDRELGFPMAWYFFMLCKRKVSQRIAEAIHLDIMGAYDYLPPRDVKVLRDWVKHPYSI